MGAAETTGARGQRVSDARLATTIRGFGLDAEGWSVAESWLDLRDARADNARLATALAASEARVAELERQVAGAERTGMERAARIAHAMRGGTVETEGFMAGVFMPTQPRHTVAAIRAAMPAAAAKEG